MCLAGGCKRRVAAVLLGEDYMLAGDTQGCIWQYTDRNLPPTRLVTGLTSPITGLRINSGLLLISGYSGCVTWREEGLAQGKPEMVGRVTNRTPVTASLHTGPCLITSGGDGKLSLYHFRRGIGRRVERLVREDERRERLEIEDRVSREEREPQEDALARCSLCGADSDSAEHFFLLCPALARPRQLLLQGLDKVISGIRWAGRERQLEVILYGVDDVPASLAIRDVVQTFVIRARS